MDIQNPYLANEEIDEEEELISAPAGNAGDPEEEDEWGEGAGNKESPEEEEDDEWE